MALQPAEQGAGDAFTPAGGTGLVTDVAKPLAGGGVVAVTQAQGGEDLLPLEGKIGGGGWVARWQMQPIGMGEQLVQPLIRVELRHLIERQPGGATFGHVAAVGGGVGQPSGPALDGGLHQVWVARGHSGLGSLWCGSWMQARWRPACLAA